MRLLLLFLLWPGLAFAEVSGVDNPAEVNSVTTPDKVSGVAGLAAGGSCTTANDAQLIAFDDNGSGGWDINSGDYIGQGWVYTPGSAYDITGLSVWMGRASGTAGTITVNVYTVDGGHEPDTFVTGATATINISTISYPGASETFFEFASAVEFDSGTEYVAVWEGSEADPGNGATYVDPSNGAANGYSMVSDDSGSSWSLVSNTRSYRGDGVFGCD